MNTVRTNKQAIFVASQEVDGSAATLTRANAIPISSDVGKSFIDDNSVEIPVLKDRLGANDSVIISETQGATIPTYPLGGGLAADNKAYNRSPLDPLLLGSFHKLEEFERDLTTPATGGSDARIGIYSPVDDPVKSATIRYQYDKFFQEMENAFGSTSFSAEVGSPASMSFRYQAAYKAPEKLTEAKKLTGTTPTFRQIPVVTGASEYLKVNGLPPELNCVTSFNLNQNSTLSDIDCITREGGNPIKYQQSGRSATGEISFYIDADTIEELFRKAGGKMFIEAPLKLTADGNDIIGMFSMGKPGNKIVIGAQRFKIGGPTASNNNNIGIFTCPITFIPEGDKPDYQIAFVGDLNT